MDFQATRDALVAWWQTMGVQVLVQGEPRPMTVAYGANAGVKAVLNITSVARLGVDEVDFDTDHGTQQLARVSGNRTITVSCRVESRDHTPSKSARHFCERARTRLRLPRIMTALQAAGLAQIDTGPTFDLPVISDDRQLSAAAFEARFGVLAEETETTDFPTDTIGAVEVSSNAFKNVDGTNTQEQMAETIEEPGYSP